MKRQKQTNREGKLTARAVQFKVQLPCSRLAAEKWGKVRVLVVGKVLVMDSLHGGNLAVLAVDLTGDEKALEFFVVCFIPARHVEL